MSFKLGDKVEVLHYEEDLDDAPSEYIGRVGHITSLTKSSSGVSRNIEVAFEDRDEDIFNDWDFSPDQLKVVETD